MDVVKDRNIITTHLCAECPIKLTRNMIRIIHWGLQKIDNGKKDMPEDLIPVL